MSKPLLQSLDYYNIEDCYAYLETVLPGTTALLRDYIRNRFNPSSFKETYQVDLNDMTGEEIYYGLEYQRYPVSGPSCRTVNEALSLFRNEFGIMGGFFTDNPYLNQPPQ